MSRLQDVIKPLSAPVMEFIRRAKIGSAIRMYGEDTMRAMQAKGGALTLAEKQAIGHSIMEHLNNVLGQIPREQLYFSRAIKDWMQISFAFPKWQLGSVRLAASAGTGLAKIMTKTPYSQLPLREQKAVNFALGAVVVHGTIMTLMNRMLAGEWPKETKDFIAARSGYMDDNGNPIRLWNPDYFRTYYSMYKAPFRWLGNTVTSPASELFHVLTNMDYWNNQIRNPNDPFLRQAVQVGWHELGQMVPFSIQARNRMVEQMPEHPYLATAASFMGVQPSPRSLSQTSTQNMADEISRTKYGSMTPEKQEDVAAKRRVIESLKAGKDAAPEDMAVLSPQQQRGLMKGPLSDRTRFDRTIERWEWPDIAKIYTNAMQQGDQKDLETIRTRIALKVRSAMKKPGLGMSERDRGLYMPLIIEALKPKEEPESKAVER
jgi:hypothetical protein